MLCLPLVPGLLFGQKAGSSPESIPLPAGSYEQCFAELMALEPLPDRMAEVNNLVIQRDVAQFDLANGKLYVLSPVGGRRVAAVFHGKGVFRFTPPTRIEQERLAEFYKSPSLEEPFSELVLIFADSTLAELEANRTFAEGKAPEEVRRRVKEALSYLGDDGGKSLDVDVMGTLLNAEASGLFYAHVGRTRGDPVMFMLNPYAIEGVRLMGRARRTGWTRIVEVVSQFRPRADSLQARGTNERRRLPTIRHYTIETSLPRNSAGEVSFSAAAKLEITTDTAVGPWLAFRLYRKLEIDSARWEDGESATVFKNRESSLLWVHAGRQLSPGDMRTLSLFYHGDLIDRYGDWFFIKSSVAWYPRPLEGRSLATFDLTFHTPKSFLLASVGERKDSSEVGRIVTTRWVTQGPIRNASFNLGLFEEHRVQAEGIPPVILLYSEEGHRALKRVALRGRNMKEQVGADVTSSMRFFQQVFGEAPVQRFYATEIPYFHGEAFPGMIHLSFITFHQTDREGEDEVFRAHEVAHQWWGIGVDFATYHDQWLSEGFSNFAGLWYLQTARRETDKYFDMLRRWRADILLRKGEPVPIWLGYRTATVSREEDYNAIVYQKGAWVVHMLRVLMLELQTMKEDRFTEMMRDFYRSFRGTRASTEDFQKVVARHTGVEMGWFFNQWVYGTGIPTYRVAYQSEPAAGGKYRVTLRVDQENVPEDFLMYVPVSIDLGDNRWARARVRVQGPRSEIELPLIPGRPKGLRFNDFDGVLAEVKMVKWTE